MVPPLGDAVVSVMAVKYAQRRSAADVSAQLKRDVRLVLGELRMLERMGLTRMWPDETWGLTSEGNLLRNRLTA